MIVTINFWGKKNITSFIRVFCFPDGSAGKESTCNVGDLGSIPGFGSFPGEGNGYPLQYSGLQNFMNCIAHGVAKSQTRLSNFHFHFSGIGMKIDLVQSCGHC